MSHFAHKNKVVKKSPPLTILGTEFNISKDTFKYHIYLIVIFSLIFKIATILFTTYILHTFIDYFDLRNYVLNSLYISHGQLPYLDFAYEYPFLAIGLNLISSIPGILLNNITLLFTTFQMLMIIFDILTAIGVYLIALKIYSEKTAFIASLIYTLSLVAAYTTVTRFDSFPVFLLVWSILFIIYNNKYGYFYSIFGFFTKIFPLIALPFEILYFKDYKKDIKQIIIISSILFVMFILPFIFFVGWSDAIKPYIFATGATTTQYANTFIFTLFSWFNTVFKLPMDYSLIYNGMYGVMFFIISLFLLSAYRSKEMKPVDLVSYVGISIAIIIMCAKFHSPQYFMWFMPFLAILVADKLEKIGVFLLLNIFAYLEFPVLWSAQFYTNTSYSNPAGSYGWYITLFFFTAEYIILIILLKMCSERTVSDIKETIKYYAHQ